MMTRAQQIKLGAKMEKDEHHVTLKIAEGIAKDHLREFPNYYIELPKFEAKLKKMVKKK